MNFLPVSTLVKKPGITAKKSGIAIMNNNRKYINFEENIFKTREGTFS